MLQCSPTRKFLRQKEFDPSLCKSNLNQFNIISRNKNPSEKRKRSNYCYSDTEDFITDSSGSRCSQIDQPQQENYTCTVPNCNKKFRKRKYLRNHILTHTNGKPFICNELGCGKRFSLLSYLRKHKKRHSFNKVMNDESGCSKLLPLLRYQKRHNQIQVVDETQLQGTTDDEQEPIDDHQKDEENKYAKLSCDKMFNKQMYLDIHPETQNEKPFVCNKPGCDKRFALLYILKAHKKRHNDCDMSERFINCSAEKIKVTTQPISYSKDDGAEVIRCIECNKIFTRERSLENHLAIHKGKKLFVCNVPGCRKGFFASDYLKKHQRRRHMKPAADSAENITIPEINNNKEMKSLKVHKMIICNVDGCNKVFRSQYDLDRHLVTHSDERPFECGINGCKRNYKRIDHLKTHQRATHLNPKKVDQLQVYP